MHKILQTQTINAIAEEEESDRFRAKIQIKSFLVYLEAATATVIVTAQLALSLGLTARGALRGTDSMVVAVMVIQMEDFFPLEERRDKSARMGEILITSFSTSGVFKQR